MPCWPGTAPGAWHQYEWLLRNSTFPNNKTHAGNSSARCATPLFRFIHAEHKRCKPKVPSVVPGAGSTNLPSCSYRDEDLLTKWLSNASILMAGDSTAAQLLWHGCEAFGKRPRPFIPIDARAYNITQSKLNQKYKHRLRSLDNHACTLPGGLVFGSFSHYGATGPPYWVFAYPLAPWLRNTSAMMARHDMPKFKSVTPNGADPTLVVASSGFWDIASWWAHEANFSRGWHLSANHTARYVAGVKKLVHHVRRAFPNSAVAWRLMHPGAKHSITPRIVTQLNNAIRANAPSWRLPLIDAEAMVSSLSRDAQPALGRGPPYGTQDGRHLHGFVNLALFNLLLNLAQRALEGRTPYSWRGGGGGGGGGGFRTSHLLNGHVNRSTTGKLGNGGGGAEAKASKAAAKAIAKATGVKPPSSGAKASIKASKPSAKAPKKSVLERQTELLTASKKQAEMISDWGQTPTDAEWGAA